MQPMRSNPPDEEKMRLRLADLCARTEQCRHDLDQKMRRAGLSEEGRQRGGFIDERRYACAFSRDKVRFAGWGRQKIRQALSAKRLDSDAIDEGLRAISRDEYIGSLKRSALAKARQLDLSLPADRMKLYRHLASRDFESAFISKIVSYLGSF